MSKTQNAETADSSETVYVARYGRDAYHTNEDCDRLGNSENTYTRRLDQLPDRIEECSLCSGELDEKRKNCDNQKYANNPLQVMLNAGIDPIEQGVDLDQFHEIPDELRDRIDDE